MKNTYAIITFSAFSAICLICLFLTPAVTINNFPAIEMINWYLFLFFWVSGIIAIIIAVVRWKKIPNYARVAPFITVSVWVFIVLLYKLGTPAIGAEIQYLGGKDWIAVEFSHGRGASGFGIKKGEVWKNDDVGRVTNHYGIEVKSDYGGSVERKLPIDMTKEVPRFGYDRTLCITITDGDIKYEVRKK